jgi:hypothetical protein
MSLLLTSQHNALFINGISYPHGVTGPQGDSIIGPQGLQGPQGQGFMVFAAIGSENELDTLNFTQSNIGQFVLQTGGRLYVCLGSFLGTQGFQNAYEYVNDLTDETIIIGPQGFQGYTGVTGPQGVLGSQGIQGNSIIGPQGPQGDSILGPQGHQGNFIIGPQGPQGESILGPQGHQGISILGPQGYTGVTGPQGVLGPQGYTGVTGPQGQSIIGPQGNQGDSVIGPQGDSIIGPQGYQGESITGPQGISGPQGNSIIGPQGFQGPESSGTLASWGSFWSTETQINLDSSGNKMTINQFDPSNNGITVVNNSRLTIQNNGVYNIQFSAQIQKLASPGTKNLEIWFAKNGINIPDSNTNVSLDNQNSFVVASWNFMLPLQANDYVEIIWYSADIDIQLTYYTNIVTPNVPSVIITVQQVTSLQNSGGNNISSISSVSGPQGPQGPQGVIGTQGNSVIGPQGPQGVIGTQGNSVIGPQGFQGIAGSFSSSVLFNQGTDISVVPGNNDNYNISQGTLFIISSASGTPTITGLQGGLTGRFVIIVNISTVNVKFENASIHSLDNNRFILNTNTITLGQNRTVSFIYGTTSLGTRWILTGNT